jgi:hypothetical protein
MTNEILETAEKIHPALASWDILIILVFLGLSMWYAYTIGKDHIITLMTALYISAFPFFFIPGLRDWIPQVEALSPDIIILIAFGVLFFLTFYFLTRNDFFAAPIVPSLWEIAVFTILFVGLFTAVVGSLLSPDFFTPSQIVNIAFMSQEALLVWSVAPIISYMVIKGN